MYGYAEQVQILCDAGAKNCIPKKSRGRLHDTIASIQYQIVKSYSIRESDKDIRVTALPEGLSKNKFKERLDNLKTRKIIKSSFKEENGQYVIQFRKLCDMEKELGLDKVSLSKLETDQHGYTPLGLAIQNRHFAAAEILLKFGADPFDNVENPYENPFCPYWLVLGTYFYQRKSLAELSEDKKKEDLIKNIKCGDCVIYEDKLARVVPSQLEDRKKKIKGDPAFSITIKYIVTGTEEVIEYPDTGRIAKTSDCKTEDESRKREKVLKRKDIPCWGPDYEYKFFRNKKTNDQNSESIENLIDARHHLIKRKKMEEKVRNTKKTNSWEDLTNTIKSEDKDQLSKRTYYDTKTKKIKYLLSLDANIETHELLQSQNQTFREKPNLWEIEYENWKRTFIKLKEILKDEKTRRQNADQLQYTETNHGEKKEDRDTCKSQQIW